MVAKLRDLLRRYGAYGVLQALGAKCLAKMGLRVHRMRVLVHTLGEADTTPPLPAYREMTYADFVAHRADDPAWFTDAYLAKMERRFKVPATRAFGCFESGQLVAYGFTSERYLGYSHRGLEAGDGYLWDGYTLPQHRGKGWHGALIRIREQVLREAGKTRAVGIVAQYNRASYRGFQRAGYTLLESYRYGTRWGKPFFTMRYGIPPKKREESK